MTTDGRQVIRAFVDHEHEELASGIDRMHEVASELPLLEREAEAWTPEWRD